MKLSCFILLGIIQIGAASLGDRLILYRNLYRTCIRQNCSTEAKIADFEHRQPSHLKLFGWNCTEECKLQSQWKTMRELERNGIKELPQFFGKWTFYRLFGIQEPASVIFSALNLFANLWGWWDYHHAIGRKDSNYRMNTIQTIIAINAWFWSILFHARDTSFTEKMDYYSAILVIICSLYCIIHKSLKEYSIDASLRLAIPFLSFYAYHVGYLHFVHFDYGYNMQANIILGLCSTLCWLHWCFRHRHNRPHVRKCFLILVYINLTLLLELYDFVPLMFTFDSHSIWHLSTVPVPLWWFGFLKKEAYYEVTSRSLQETKKIK